MKRNTIQILFIVAILLLTSVVVLAEGKAPTPKESEYTIDYEEGTLALNYGYATSAELYKAEDALESNLIQPVWVPTIEVQSGYKFTVVDYANTSVYARITNISDEYDEPSDFLQIQLSERYDPPAIPTVKVLSNTSVAITGEANIKLYYADGTHQYFTGLNEDGTVTPTNLTPDTTYTLVAKKPGSNEERRFESNFSESFSFKTKKNGYDAPTVTFSNIGQTTVTIANTTAEYEYRFISDKKAWLEYNKPEENLWSEWETCSEGTTLVEGLTPNHYVHVQVRGRETEERVVGEPGLATTLLSFTPIELQFHEKPTAGNDYGTYKGTVPSPVTFALYDPNEEYTDNPWECTKMAVTLPGPGTLEREIDQFGKYYFTSWDFTNVQQAEGQSSLLTNNLTKNPSGELSYNGMFFEEGDTLVVNRIGISEPIHIKANWGTFFAYTLTLDANCDDYEKAPDYDGEKTKTENHIYYNKQNEPVEVVVPTPTTFVKPGYRIDKWATRATDEWPESTGYLNPGDTIKLSSGNDCNDFFFEGTLYARWKEIPVEFEIPVEITIEGENAPDARIYVITWNFGEEGPSYSFEKNTNGAGNYDGTLTVQNIELSKFDPDRAQDIFLGDIQLSFGRTSDDSSMNWEPDNINNGYILKWDNESKQLKVFKNNAPVDKITLKYTYTEPAPGSVNLMVSNVRMATGKYIANGASELSDKKPESGGYAYLAEDGKTLILKDYNYNGDGRAITGQLPELNIVLVGNSTISCDSGIYNSGKLNLEKTEADGKLSITSSDGYGTSILANGVSIGQGVEISISNTSPDPTQSKGICSQGGPGITINGATVNILGGIQNGIKDNNANTILIKDSKITMTKALGNENGLQPSGLSAGNHMEKGNITIDRSEINITNYNNNFDCKDLTITNSDVKLDNSSIRGANAITQSYGGTIYIKDSNLEFNAWTPTDPLDESGKLIQPGDQFNPQNITIDLPNTWTIKAGKNKDSLETVNQSDAKNILENDSYYNGQKMHAILVTGTIPEDTTPKTYTLTYNANGGTGSVASQTYSGEALTVSEGNGLTNGEKAFASWNTLSDGSGTKYEPGASITLTKDITLWAQYGEDSSGGESSGGESSGGESGGGESGGGESGGGETPIDPEKPEAEIAGEPQAIIGIIYNGDEHVLVQPGTSDSGTVQYSLDGTNFTNEIPTVKDAGTYEVYYKVKGDADHNNSEVFGPITVTIAKRTITPVISGDTTKVYDGTITLPQNHNVTITFADAAIGENPVVTVETYEFNSKDVTSANTLSANGIELDSDWEKNYELSATTATTSASVTKKDITVVWQNTNGIYDGNSFKPAYIVRGVIDEDNVTVTVDNNYAQIEAGTYPIEAVLTSDGDGNYAFYPESNKTSFTIEQAPIIFEISNNVRQEGDNSPLSTGFAPNTSLNNADYNVVYRDVEGNEIDPLVAEKGTYDIFIEITNTNYRHEGSSNGTAKKVGVLVVTEPEEEPPLTYTITYDANGGTGTVSDTSEVFEGTVRNIKSGDTLTNSTKVFAGWEYKGKTYKPGDNFTQPADNVIFKAIWIVNTYNVEGAVEDDKTPVSNKVEDAKVTLKKGNEIVAETITDTDGTFAFNNIAPGKYNMEVSKGDRTMTELVEITNSDWNNGGKPIVLPEGKLNAIVDVKPGTPTVLVGGLEKNFEEEDRTKSGNGAGGGYTIDLKLTAESTIKDENHKDAIVSNDENTQFFIDLTLTKTETQYGHAPGTPQTITNALKLLEIVIELPADLQGRKDYSVYRHHGEVQQITTTKNADNEYIVIAKDRKSITLYVKKFSLYAIAATGEATSGSGGSGSGHGGGSTVVPIVNPNENMEPGNIENGVTPLSPQETGVASLLITDDHIHYINGYEAGDVRPDGKMTREEAAQMFYNLLLDKSAAPDSGFFDVDQNRWSKVAIDKLVSLGIVTGFEDGSFMPEKKITREQFCAMAVRFAKTLNLNGEFTVKNFNDVIKEMWSYDSVMTASQIGWVNGYADGYFIPAGDITRAEVVTIVNKMIGRNADKAFVDSANGIKKFTDLNASHWAYYNFMEATNGHDYEMTNGVEKWIMLNSK